MPLHSDDRSKGARNEKGKGLRECREARSSNVAASETKPASQPERESESEGLTDWLTGLPLLACGGLIDLPSSLLCCAALCACFAPFFTDLLAFASPLLPFYEHPPSWAAMTPNTSPPPRRARFMSSRRSSIRSTRSLPSPCALFSVTNTTFRLARAF